MEFDIKDINGYEGLYAITTTGRVWSYRNKKFLKPGMGQSGYLHIGLNKNGVRKNFSIHRLVAEAFIENTKGRAAEVNHIDENKLNNRVSNLEWLTHEENVNYGTRNKRVREALGKPVYCIELDQVFKSQKAAAEALGVPPGCISACCRGQTKTAGKKHYSFRYATLDELDQLGD